MKVILLQDVKGTGKKDDVVNVSDGFARNYLFPRKWAVEATENAAKEIERKRAAARQREMEQRAEAETLARSLKDKVIVVEAKCGDKGRLYGSITGQEVAEALKNQYHMDIDKRKIDMGDPIRNVGDVQVTVRLYPNVTTRMIVRVTAVEK